MYHYDCELRAKFLVAVKSLVKVSKVNQQKQRLWLQKGILLSAIYCVLVLG